MQDISKLRREYDQDPLDIKAFEDCPFDQFEHWFMTAANRLREPNAMVISTVDSNGAPTQRSVLLKYYDKTGFVFFTNYQSRKANHIFANSQVSVLFPWYACQWQLEINGIAQNISNAEAIKYFALRPRGSQLGAWVSHQNGVVSARGLLLNRLNEMQEKFSKGEIPMPPSWGGFRIVPKRFEFWQGGRDRLHDRIEYTRQCSDNCTWSRCRLAP